MMDEFMKTKNLMKEINGLLLTKTNNLTLQ